MATANANVVSTQGAHAQVEITSAGEVVRTNSAPPKPLKKIASGIAKAVANGFDTVTTHKEADSYLLGDPHQQPSLEELRGPAAKVLPPKAYETILQNHGNGSFYTSNLCFGHTGLGGEPMCLPGIPDTGSFELVVRSARCRKCSPPFYNDSMSLSYVEYIDKANHTQLMYGSGPVDALWVNDDVALEGSHAGSKDFFTTWTGGGEPTGITVKQQRLLEVIKTPIKEFANGKEMCGIFGVGRGKKEGRGTRFIQRAGIQRYSICLPRDDNANGSMWWQTDDPKNNSLYKPINVVGQFHWAVELTRMKLHYDKKPPLSKFTGMPPIESLATGKSCAILDSGTTLISPTPEMATKLTAAIQTQGLNCNDVSNLPTLEFELDGQLHRLPPEAYVANISLVDENVSHISKQLLHFDPNAGCMLLLTQPMAEPPTACPSMILGMPFFRFYKTVFDWDAYSEKNTTDTGMIYTAEHSDCEDGYNSWDVTAANYIGKSIKAKGQPRHHRRFMTIDLKKIKFPKAPAHYFQYGKL